MLDVPANVTRGGEGPGGAVVVQRDGDGERIEIEMPPEGVVADDHAVP